MKTNRKTEFLYLRIKTKPNHKAEVDGLNEEIAKLKPKRILGFQRIDYSVNLIGLKETEWVLLIER